MLDNYLINDLCKIVMMYADIDAFTEEYLEWLIKIKVNINIVDCDGNTPLHIFVDKHAKLLLGTGISPNVKNHMGRTPLSLARNIYSIKLLLEYGAYVDAQCTDGETILHYYTLDEKFEENIVKLLLEKGANPNIKNNTGNSVLYDNIKNGVHKYIKLLLKYGADESIKRKLGNFYLMNACGSYNELNRVLKEGLNPNIIDGHRNTLLHHVAMDHGMGDRYRLLIKYGANPNLKNKFGNIASFYFRH